MPNSDINVSYRWTMLDKDGKELSINPGKSYFAINETGKSSVE